MATVGSLLLIALKMMTEFMTVKIADLKNVAGNATIASYLPHIHRSNHRTVFVRINGVQESVNSFIRSGEMTFGIKYRPVFR